MLLGVIGKDITIGKGSFFMNYWAPYLANLKLFLLCCKHGGGRLRNAPPENILVFYKHQNVIYVYSKFGQFFNCSINASFRTW